MVEKAIILLATRSEGKRRELATLLAPLGRTIVTLDDVAFPADPGEDDLETGATFEENALAKARWFHTRTALPTLADDSGLEVDALGGEPGIRSKRWSGRADLDGAALDAINNLLLLASLRAAEAAGQPWRGARYVCAAAYVDAARAVTQRGEVRGLIVSEPRGAGGFGYDPYFWSPELGCTFAEASADEKGSISHRGRAIRALRDAIGE